MLSRNETIEQILSRMKPKEPSAAPASFSGPVTQVNIINNATIHIETLQILANGELNNVAEQLCPQESDTVGKKEKMSS